MTEFALGRETESKEQAWARRNYTAFDALGVVTGSSKLNLSEEEQQKLEPAKQRFQEAIRQMMRERRNKLATPKEVVAAFKKSNL
jgi:hypothetical protein